MLDSEIKLAQCQRCQAYVWTADVSGMRVAVDPAPLGDLGAVMATLGAMRSVYAVQHIGRKPHHLKWLGGQNTQWDPKGRTLVAAHGCGAPPRDAKPVEVAPEGPQQAPVTPGGAWGGVRPQAARDSGSQGHTTAPWAEVSSVTRRSPAERATRRRSDVLAHIEHVPHVRPLKCQQCRCLISAGEEFVAIECGRYSWAHHDYDCTADWRKKGEKVQRLSRDVGWDASDQLYRKGNWNRDVENVIEGL